MAVMVTGSCSRDKLGVCLEEAGCCSAGGRREPCQPALLLGRLLPPPSAFREAAACVHQSPERVVKCSSFFTVLANLSNGWCCFFEVVDTLK